jgi:hypothetical protein
VQKQETRTRNKKQETRNKKQEPRTTILLIKTILFSTIFPFFSRSFGSAFVKSGLEFWFYLFLLTFFKSILSKAD